MTHDPYRLHNLLTCNFPYLLVDMFYMFVSFSSLWGHSIWFIANPLDSLGYGYTVGNLNLVAVCPSFEGGGWTGSLLTWVKEYCL